MRILRPLLLTCAAALAVLALGAADSSATESIEVTDEGGNPCGPCLVHVTGESEVHHATFGEISDCQDEFEGELYHTDASSPSGTWGHITHWNGADHPVNGPCTREMCDGAGGEGTGEDEWPITNAEETGEDQAEMNVRFCLDSTSEEPEGAGLHCNADVSVTDDNNHNLTFSTTATCASEFGDFTVTGNWSTEATEDSHHAIKIVHGVATDEAVEVDREDGVNCNPCLFHATGELEFHHPLFGEITDCQDEFEGELYHADASSPSGTWGHITQWNGVDHPVDGACTREMCDGTGGEPSGEGEWPITNAEETAANETETIVRLCFDATNDEPEGAGLHCSADVLLTDNNNHNLTFSTTATCTSSVGDFTVTGNWSSESTTHDAIDVIHLGV